MDKNFSNDYRKLEQEYWWFRARREILQQFIADLELPEFAEILEIGVGGGANLYHIYPPKATLYGVEPDPENALYADSLGPIPVYTGTAEQLPHPLHGKQFDAISMFDVLEHTENDDLVLENLFQNIKPGGFLLLSVPAYSWMWGKQDIISHHFRRYSRQPLLKKIKKHGFTIHQSTYFNTLLFPPIALVRLLARPFIGKKDAAEVTSDFEYQTGALNELLYRIFRAEKSLLRRISLPFGVSLFCCAKKPM